ncbi:hypothetical protein ABG067_008840, partial [Albugo candida]
AAAIGGRECLDRGGRAFGQFGRGACPDCDRPDVDVPRLGGSAGREEAVVVQRRQIGRRGSRNAVVKRFDSVHAVIRQTGGHRTVGEEDDHPLGRVAIGPGLGVVPPRAGRRNQARRPDHADIVIGTAHRDEVVGVDEIGDVLARHAAKPLDRLAAGRRARIAEIGVGIGRTAIPVADRHRGGMGID